MVGCPPSPAGGEWYSEPWRNRPSEVRRSTFQAAHHQARATRVANNNTLYLLDVRVRVFRIGRIPAPLSWGSLWPWHRQSAPSSKSLSETRPLQCRALNNPFQALTGKYFPINRKLKYKHPRGEPRLLIPTAHTPLKIFRPLIAIILVTALSRWEACMR